MPSDYVWPHLSELPAFRALIRSIEHRLLAEQKPFAAPVLDVGIGDGHFAAAALGTGLDVGIDVDWQTMREAQRRGIYCHILDASATAMPFPPNYFATIISNCVINLAPDKPAVFREIARVLKPGGRLAVSDIALKKPLPAELGEDMMAYVGCIAGAVLIEEYRRHLADAGFAAVQVIDTGADLNAYAKVENQSGCCSPPSALPAADPGCCEAPADTRLHHRLMDLLARYDVNEYAASVRVFAVKP